MEGPSNSSHSTPSSASLALGTARAAGAAAVPPSLCQGLPTLTERIYPKYSISFSLKPFPFGAPISPSWGNLRPGGKSALCWGGKGAVPGFPHGWDWVQWGTGIPLQAPAPIWVRKKTKLGLKPAQGSSKLVIITLIQQKMGDLNSWEIN